MAQPHVVLLNWKAAEETIECLGNILESTDEVKVVVADNDSQDGSLGEIVGWARERGLKAFLIEEGSIGNSTLDSESYDLIVIANARNHGFAGGNNSAIRFALDIGRADIVWLLNNDARINERTFSELARRLRDDHGLGFVGSVIRYFESPDRLQCFGGVLIHRFLGKRTLYGKNLSLTELATCDENEVDCLMGASLAFRAEVVRDVGLMDEAYFMYGEEVDWQLRAQQKGWRIGVARESHIFHKGAQSTRGRSHMYHYYLNRSSVMFSKRFYGARSLVTVLPSLISIVLIQNWKNPKNVFFGWKGILAGAAYSWKS